MYENFVWGPRAGIIFLYHANRTLLEWFWNGFGMALAMVFEPQRFCHFVESDATLLEWFGRSFELVFAKF